MPGRRFDSFTPDKPPERPADPAVRRENFRRIVRLFRPYKARLSVVCVLIVFSASLGAVSPFLLREVLDVAIPEENVGLLSALVAGMVAIPIATGIIGVWQTLLSNQVGQSVMHDLRSQVYRHLQRLSLAFFTRTRTGEVQSRIANDIGGIETVVTSTATSVLSNVTTVLATVAAMVLLDWRLAAFSLALLPLFVWLTKRVGAQRRKVTAERQASLADVSSIVQESLSVSGILLGKTMGRTDDLAVRFERESSRLADLEVRSRMTGRWMMAAIQTSFAVMPALVYWFAGFTIAQGSATITIGTLVAFTTLQTRLFFPIGGLLGVQLEVQSSLALFDRIFEYLDHRVDIVEGERSIELAPGAVSLDSVWFRYEDGPWTLQDVSFVVPPGTKTALVGETGSGKTTCAYLVARLYDATSGGVSIDGMDVRELTFDSLAATVGVVSQETYLFHSTVRENLRFAQPHASDEEIEQAARAAQIHELIAGLPDGYETVVGERGYRFSGGEKQRIAIARTILRNPPVLVLDEATSSLDTQTERLVQEALERLSEGRTTIAIAHRLSTVEDADQIVVLDRGRVVEVGTYDELVARAGRFAALAAREDLVEPPAVAAADAS
ncbi:MAG: ABC transporter ATP-binding protein [Actinobacteria bacterium]|nr:ABC transporter ATP-binding protein [Actinomycetota bacterium]